MSYCSFFWFYAANGARSSDCRVIYLQGKRQCSFAAVFEATGVVGLDLMHAELHVDGSQPLHVIRTRPTCRFAWLLQSSARWWVDPCMH
jgi:hypothetical protein